MAKRKYTEMEILLSLIKRIGKRLQKLNSCYELVGVTDTNGYTQLPITGKPNRPGHKVIYELLVKKVPKNMELDHLCRNRKCVNPDHLEVVTHKVNNLRGFGPAAMNARKTHCINGHKYTKNNTYLHKGNRKSCKECSRQNYLNKKNSK